MKSEIASGDLRVLRIDCGPVVSVGDLELEVAHGDSWVLESDRCTSCECEVS